MLFAFEIIIQSRLSSKQTQTLEFKLLLTEEVSNIQVWSFVQVVDTHIVPDPLISAGRILSGFTSL